ncbi:PREDICTED: heparan-sulfate 6-O-sulfotransferase 2-like [Nipponia nippon]|nr:PREDICTED: heparan-sulfate 6-O-sulfotransferase 2-like [Nipponia nippon]
MTPNKMIKIKSLGVSLLGFCLIRGRLANNRQVRMLSDLSLVGCYNLSVMPEEQRNKVLLDSAKENLKRMAFFGLTEFQRKTQYLFEKTFNMNFISPFTQYNSTRASSVEIDEQTQQRIEALNFLDMELYDYAKDLFLQRYQYMRQKEHQEARRKRQEQRKILRAKQAHLREQGENSSSTDYIGNVERWRREGDINKKRKRAITVTKALTAQGKRHVNSASGRLKLAVIDLVQPIQAQAAGQALFPPLVFLLPPLCRHWCRDGHLETWFKELICLETNHWPPAACS